MNIKLREVRKKAKVTQGNLAKMIGVDIKTVGNWERGVTVMNIEQVWDCCVVLGCTPNDLCGWYEDHPRPGAQAPPDPYARELAACFEEAGGEGRRTILEVARAVRAASGEGAQRGGAGAEGVA